MDPEHVFNVSCRVRNERHKHGIVTFKAEERNVDHYMVHVQLFHQNSAGRFLPYLFDFYNDVCEWEKMANGSLFNQIRYHFWNLQLSSKEEHNPLECPFSVSSLDALTKLYFGL